MSDDQGPLPAAIEEQVFQAFFALAEQARDAAIEELAGRHPDHATEIRDVAAKLRAGAGIFAELGTMDGALPESIGPYRILEKLGEGGFGIVFLAEQSEPIKRRVALKCLLPGMDSRRVLARFEAERQALAMMDHPNIARVYDARSLDRRPYFVMEYIPGVPITTYCDDQRLSVRARLGLFLEVCDAVQHAHQKGVIHRDIKPSNILVMDQGGRPQPKVIDFGVAKAIYQPLTMRTMHTEIGRMIGTPEYMSPEQTSPTPLDVDTRTDIYSLGVLLYEILTGSLPFRAEDLRAGGPDAAHRVLQEQQPPRPSARVRSTDDKTSSDVAARRGTRVRVLADELRGDLDWIVLRAMAKERSRRYATAQELAADIERHLRAEPVLARPPHVSYRVGKFVQRHRTQVVAAAIVLVALVAGLVASTVFYLRERDSLQNFERLADRVLLDELQRQAQVDLWPEHPDRADAMRTWLERARALAARRVEHAATVNRLREHLDGDGGFADGSTRFLFDTLSQLVRELEALAAPDGRIADVGQRLAWASTVHQRTVADHAVAWERSAAAVARDPRFGGLRLEPQLGLVPLGADPDTGLQEFGHPRTGTVPPRGRDGLLQLGEDTGLVFVLVPGGRFLMGAQPDDVLGPGFVRDAAPFEKPVHEVALGPFFVSKFEMTQGQWQRLTGGNPSRFRPGTDRPAMQHITLRNPVESVGHRESIEVLARVGLVLPTEAQWEHACRAGTRTAFYTGDDVQSLKGHANLFDEGSKQFFPPPHTLEKGFVDGHACHAPVGSFAANPFGLYDVHGNVSELTLEQKLFYYENPTDPVTGERSGNRGSKDLVPVRGGNFSTAGFRCRSAFRSGEALEQRSWVVGLRPVQRIGS